MMSVSLRTKALLSSRRLPAVSLGMVVLLLSATVAAEIKQARSTGLTFLPSNGEVNILSIDFTAPGDGFVSANAVGYCNMLSPTTLGSGSGQAVIGISTDALTLGDFPQAF